MRQEYLAVGAVLAAVLAVGYLLALGRSPSTLLVVFVLLVGVLLLVPGVWPTLYRTTGVGAGAWLLAAGVAGGGIALSYAVGDPRPFCEGIVLHRGCLTAFGWASVVYLASTLALAVGVGHLGRYRLLRSVSAEPAREVSGGVVAVEGRVVPVDTVPGPVSGEPTAWYQSAVERPTLFRAHREVDRETADTEFYVADGSGRLLVLPDGLDDHDVTALARAHTDDDDRRRREWSYQPDDAVTVVGEQARCRVPSIRNRSWSAATARSSWDAALSPNSAGGRPSEPSSELCWRSFSAAVHCS